MGNYAFECLYVEHEGDLENKELKEKIAQIEEEHIKKIERAKKAKEIIKFVIVLNSLGFFLVYFCSR